MYYRETSAARTELAQGTEAKVRTQNFRKAPHLSSCDVALELPPSRYRNISDVNGSPFPAYSDEIVQDLHLLPFYPLLLCRQRHRLFAYLLIAREIPALHEYYTIFNRQLQPFSGEKHALMSPAAGKPFSARSGSTQSAPGWSVSTRSGRRHTG